MLRILIFGNRSVSQKVSQALAGTRSYVVGISQMSAVLSLLKQDDFDIVLVDGSLAEVGSACTRIGQECPAAVALIVKGTPAEWSHLKSLEVEGFIQEEAKGAEIDACLQEIARRHKRKYTSARLLLIEDDKQIRDSLVLSFNVYWPEAKILTARTGEEGINLCRGNPVDAILLDLGLPDMSGFEVLTQIGSFSEVPVIIVTANANQEAMKKAKDLGAKDYLTKPFKQAELMSHVMRHVQGGATSGRSNSRATTVWAYVPGASA